MRALLLLAVLSSSVVMLGCPASKCSAANCATGCCDAAGACQPGTQPLACGIAGGTCTSCNLAQQCIQGSCFGATGGGGGAGGGVGGGVGGGGGTSGVTMNLIPTSATVAPGSGVDLSAELVGGAPNQQVTYIIESGGGSIVSSGPSTATFYAYSANSTVRIRAQANYLSSLSRIADFTVTNSSAPDFLVVPQTYSRTPYVLVLGAAQTFAAVRTMSAGSSAVGLRDVEWTVWPSGTITDGTVTIGSAMTRIYARERTSNVWASVPISGEAIAEESVAVTPAVSTVAPNGVVQLTAIVSIGGSVQWDIVSPNGGTVSTSGTYTAPATPGVYVVQATPSLGNGLRFAVATIIVQ